MTLKQRAFVDILKVLALGLIVGGLITLVQMYIGVANTFLILGTTFGLYCFYQAYKIRVGQLEAEAERIQRALKEGQ